MFTHEFIATFKKVDKAHNNRMLVTPGMTRFIFSITIHVTITKNKKIYAI